MKSWKHLVADGMAGKVPDLEGEIMFNAMIEEFRRLRPGMSDLIVHELMKRCEIVRFKKHAVILDVGQVCHHVLYSMKGLVRSVLHREKVEQTVWFMGEGDVVIAVESFYSQTPSKEQLIAMEETDCIALHWNDLQFIYEEYLEFNVVGRLMTEKYYRQSMGRNIWLVCSSEVRYRMLFEEYPKFLGRVPDKMLASYLGTAKSTLSRAKRKFFGSKMMSFSIIFKIFGCISVLILIWLVSF